MRNRATKYELHQRRLGLDTKGQPLYPDKSKWREVKPRLKGIERLDPRTITIVRRGEHVNTHQPGGADITNVFFEDDATGKAGTMMAHTLTSRWARVS